MTLGEKIKVARTRLGYSYSELSELSGLKKSTLQRYETGATQKIPVSAALALEKALGLSEGGLTEAGGEKKGVMIPVLGSVRAGYPILAEENVLDYEEISLKTASDGDYFALRIVGNSMEPRMFEGDTVIVRKQPCVDSGQIAVVLCGENEATIKKVIIKETGIMLVPLNANCGYEPMFYSAAEIESLPVSILGRVVEVRGKL